MDNFEFSVILCRNGADTSIMGNEGKPYDLINSNSVRLEDFQKLLNPSTPLSKEFQTCLLELSKLTVTEKIMEEVQKSSRKDYSMPSFISDTLPPQERSSSGSGNGSKLRIASKDLNKEACWLAEWPHPPPEQSPTGAIYKGVVYNSSKQPQEPILTGLYDAYQLYIYSLPHTNYCTKDLFPLDEGFKKVKAIVSIRDEPLNDIRFGAIFTKWGVKALQISKKVPIQFWLKQYSLGLVANESAENVKDSKSPSPFEKVEEKKKAPSLSLLQKRNSGGSLESEEKKKSKELSLVMKKKQWSKIESAEFGESLLFFERKFCDSDHGREIKIGVFFADSAQKSELEMAQNQLQPHHRFVLWKFYIDENNFYSNLTNNKRKQTKNKRQMMSILGEYVKLDGYPWRGDLSPNDSAYFTVWNGFQIIFHVATMMTKDQIRSKIGNDQVLICFTKSPIYPEFRGQQNSVKIVVQPCTESLASSSDTILPRKSSFKVSTRFEEYGVRKKTPNKAPKTNLKPVEEEKEEEALEGESSEKSEPLSSKKPPSLFRLSVASRPEVKLSPIIPSEPIPLDEIKDYILVNAINAQFAVMKQYKELARMFIVPREKALDTMVSTYFNKQSAF